MISEAQIQKVIDFFVTRGYLYAQSYKPVRTIKLSEALLAGKVEPRILAVLPAALLRSKSSILIDRSVPDDLKNIIKLLQYDAKLGPDYHGISYQELRRWANIKIKDARTKPQKDKKITVSFRFSLKTLQQLKQLASKHSITQTEVIENLLAK